MLELVELMFVVASLVLILNSIGGQEGGQAPDKLVALLRKIIGEAPLWDKKEIAFEIEICANVL